MDSINYWHVFLEILQEIPKIPKEVPANLLCKRYNKFFEDRKMKTRFITHTMMNNTYIKINPDILDADMLRGIEGLELIHYFCTKSPHKYANNHFDYSEDYKSFNVQLLNTIFFERDLNCMIVYSRIDKKYHYLRNGKELYSNI